MAFVSAVPAVPLSFGVPRVIQGVAITHVLGEPAAGRERERALRRDMVELALSSITRELAEPTLFRRPAA